MSYRLRWRDDAHGYVAKYAGQWASDDTFDRAEAERIIRAMPNGGQVEIVEVTP